MNKNTLPNLANQINTVKKLKHRLNGAKIRLDNLVANLSKEASTDNVNLLVDYIQANREQMGIETSMKIEEMMTIVGKHFKYNLNVDLVLEAVKEYSYREYIKENS